MKHLLVFAANYSTSAMTVCGPFILESGVDDSPRFIVTRVLACPPNSISRNIIYLSSKTSGISPFHYFKKIIYTYLHISYTCRHLSIVFFNKNLAGSRRVAGTPRLKILLSALPVDILPEIGGVGGVQFFAKNHWTKRCCRIHLRSYTDIQLELKTVK